MNSTDLSLFEKMKMLMLKITDYDEKILSSLGFECIDAGMSNPIVGRFSTFSDEYLQHQFVPGLYCHSGYMGKKTVDVDNFNWINVNMNELVGNTSYPNVKNIFLILLFTHSEI